MDDALVLACAAIIQTIIDVLILVLMDDALVHCIFNVKFFLVLMS